MINCSLNGPDEVNSAHQEKLVVKWWGDWNWTWSSILFLTGHQRKIRARMRHTHTNTTTTTSTQESLALMYKEWTIKSSYKILSACVRAETSWTLRGDILDQCDDAASCMLYKMYNAFIYYIWSFKIIPHHLKWMHWSQNMSSVKLINYNRK